MTYEQTEAIKAESAKLAKGIIKYIMLDVQDLAIAENSDALVKLITDGAQAVQIIASWNK